MDLLAPQQPAMDWTPSSEEISASNIGWLMRHADAASYTELPRWSVQHREEFMSRAVLPGMRAAGFGRIIHSLVASPCKSAYVAAKHALLGFSKALALEPADVDITSNTICPVYLRTPLVDAQIADQARTRGLSEDEVIGSVMLQPLPKKAFVTIEETSAAVEYLVHPLAHNDTF